MTETDRIKWDLRYVKKLGGSEPSSILEKYYDLAPSGKALDIACGNGRNSIFLAEKGFAVEAVDISEVVTNHLMGKHPNINVICTDLDTWKIPPDSCELIVNVRFLNRRLFPMIQNGLKPNGVLIFESFLDGLTDKYCLKQNELLRTFKSLHIIYYEEKRIDPAGKFDRIASLVAIKPESTKLESE